MPAEYKPPVDVDREHYESVVAELKILNPQMGEVRDSIGDVADESNIPALLKYVKLSERKTRLMSSLGIDWPKKGT